MVVSAASATEREGSPEKGFEVGEDNKPGKGILGLVGPDGIISDTIVVHGISAEFLRRDMRLRAVIEEGWETVTAPVASGSEELQSVTPDKVRVIGGDGAQDGLPTDPQQAIVELTLDGWDTLDQTGLAVTTYQGPLEGLMWERAG